MSAQLRLKRLLKECLGRIIVAFGLQKLALRGAAVVVAFHSITKDRSDGALRCSEQDFRAYCEFFAKHMRPMPLSSLIELLRGGEAVPDAAVCITFDDGYADNAEAAAVLTRYGLSGVFYVTTDFIGSRTQTFWDRGAGVESRWMTWDDVQTLARSGHEVGAHTKTHADLAKLNAEQVGLELGGSRDAIASRTGVLPRHFAIPFGRAFGSLDEVTGVAAACGFESVSLCRGGVVFGSSDPMRIERWPIDAHFHRSPFEWIVDVIRDAWARRSDALRS